MTDPTNSPAINPLPVWPEFTPEQYDRVHDEALERAAALRDEAIATFWHDADMLRDGALERARRAADRLAARLRQHAKRRAATSGA